MKHLYNIMILVALISCERLVDFPAEKDGRILIYAVIDDSGKSRINVSVTQPVEGTEETTQDKVRINMRADGKDIEMHPDKSNSTDAVTSYRIVGNLTPGQKMEMKAEAIGLPPVNAETVIPESLPKVSIQKNDDELKSLFNFIILIDEKPRPDNYFGIRIMKRTELEFRGNVPESVRKEYEGKSGKEEYDAIIDQMIMSENDGLSSLKKNMIVDFNGGQIMIGEGDELLGKSYFCVPVKMTYRKKLISEYDPVQNINYAIYERHEYKPIISRLSQELYNHLRAKYITEVSDTPVNLGFSPVTYSYTNIRGGLGVFAATTTYESDWFSYK